MKNDTAIKIIKGLQEGEALNDGLFAQKIGIHRVHWNRIKNGKPFGEKFLTGVIKAYPSVRHIFLPNDITNGKEGMTGITTIPSQNAQKRFLAVFSERLKGLVLGVKRLFPQSKAKSDINPKRSRRSVMKN